MARLTRIPLDIVVTATGEHTSGKLVAVMADDLDQQEAVVFEAERLADRLACLHDFDPECARCESMGPLREALKAVI